MVRWSHALLFLALPLQARVCDEASAKRVACRSLSPGVDMPMVALGSWRGSYSDCHGDNFTCAQEHAREAVTAWLGELGATHVDSANNYRTQIQVGEALKASKLDRSEVFLTTKCPGPIGFNATLQCLEDNMQMLGLYGEKGIGYIDLLLIHFPFTVKPECNGVPNTTPGCESPFYDPGMEARRETWRAMEFLQRSGKVRAVGVSDYQVQHLKELEGFATLPIAVNQVEWHPYKHDDDLQAYCRKHGIALQAWSPLSGQHGSVLKDAAIEKVAEAHNVSTAQAVLRWALQRDVSVVVGTADVAHMKSDLDVFSFNLTVEEMIQISSLNASGAIYV